MHVNPQSPRPTPKSQGQSSALDIGRLGNRLIASIIPDESLQNSSWYQKARNEYKQEVETWIRKNFPDFAADAIISSPEIQNKINRFERITPERQQRINENSQIIETIFEAHGVDPSNNSIRKELFNSIQSSNPEILSGKETLNSGDTWPIVSNFQKIIIANNENEIKKHLEAHKVDFNEKKRAQIQEKFPKLLSGEEIISENNKSAITEAIITPVVVQEMDALLSKVLQSNQDEAFTNLPSFEKYYNNLRSNDSSISIAEARDRFSKDIEALLRQNIRQQIASMVPPQEPPITTVADLKGKFPENPRLQSLNSGRPENVDELLTLQKELKEIERELIHDKAESQYSSALRKIVRDNAKYKIKTEEFPSFRDFVKNNPNLEPLFKELPNSTSLQDHQEKVKKLQKEISKSLQDNINKKLAELLPHNPIYKGELKKSLEETSLAKEYCKLVDIAKGRGLEHLSFNDVASFALNNRKYENIESSNEPLTREDISNIQEELQLQTKALRQSITYKKAEDDSALQNLKEAAAEITNQATETVSSTAKAFTAALSSAAEDALGFFGLSEIPIDKDIEQAYNAAASKAEAAGISFVTHNSKQLNIQSIDEMWVASSNRYKKENISKEDMRKRFNSRIKNITKLINQELNKLETTSRPQQQSATTRLNPQVTEAPNASPLKLFDNVKTEYAALLQKAKEANAGEYPDIESLWTTMDQFYRKEIPDRDARREQLKHDIKISAKLMEANTMAAKAANNKSVVDTFTNYFSSKTVEVPIPQELKTQYETVLANAKAAGVQGCTDLENLWTYTIDVLYQVGNQNKEEKIINDFISGVLNPTIEWMNHRTQMQPLLNKTIAGKP